MNQQLAVELIRQALITTMWLCTPILAVLFVIGIAVSLLQTLTSIQDPSFGAVPRLAALFLTLLIVLPWLLMRIITYTEQLITNLVKYVH